MREICPSCGKDMVATTEAFEVNGDAVRGIPHLLCRSCGEATFTAEQLDMVFGYRTAQKQRSMKTEGSRTLDAADAAEIRFLVDAETLGWLERESARTGIGLEKVASAMLRKACNETPALGAPDIAGLERDLAAVDKKIEDDGPHGYPKPMDPKDVKARIVGEADEHGRTVLPAEEYCEEDDVYDELYPVPFASEAEACDFADAAARDAIDAWRGNQGPFS